MAYPFGRKNEQNSARLSVQLTAAKNRVCIPNSFCFLGSFLSPPPSPPALISPPPFCPQKSAFLFPPFRRQFLTGAASPEKRGGGRGAVGSGPPCSHTGRARRATIRLVHIYYYVSISKSLLQQCQLTSALFF